MHDAAATKATIQRLLKAGCTILIGPSPETDALRIHVRKEGMGGVTRFIPWVQLDHENGDAILRSHYDEIERLMNR